MRRQGRGSAVCESIAAAHRAARVVPEHDEQRHVQHRDGVLERADDGLGDDLAGVADDEQVADSLVEDDLGREPRVAASEERGDGLLAGRDLGAALDILARMQGLAGDEALVAPHHLVPRRSRGAYCSSVTIGLRPVASQFRSVDDRGRQLRELGVVGAAVQHEVRSRRPLRRASSRSCPGWPDCRWS